MLMLMMLLNVMFLTRCREEAMSAEDIAETQAEIFARKMEQQRLVEDADLELAMDLMGGGCGCGWMGK